MRLNKFLADRGVAARRKCDEMIADGRVSVNGRVVREPGTKVEERDKVAVDGRPVGGRERHVYYVLNKPVGVITTLDDPQGRRTIREFLPRGARVYPVGRLDADTSGLLLLTNDGELAHKLMHPRYGVPKVYRVRLAREPRPDQLRRLGAGVRFEKDQVSGPARVRRIDPGFDAIMIEVTIHEGRFRQVRKMCEAVGLEVTGLHRVGYGPLRLGPMTRGMFRELSDEEVAKLRAASARPGGKSPRAGAAERAGAPAGAVPAPRPRPAAPEPVADEAEDDAGDDAEETWVAGGGMLPDDAEELADETAAPAASGWPARPAGQRGDRDWAPRGREAGGKAPRARTERPRERPARIGPRGRDVGPGPKRREFEPRERPARGGPRGRDAGPGPKRREFEPRERPARGGPRGRDAGPGPKRREFEPRERPARGGPRGRDAGPGPKRRGFEPRERPARGGPRGRDFGPRDRSAPPRGRGGASRPGRAAEDRARSPRGRRDGPPRRTDRSGSRPSARPQRGSARFAGRGARKPSRRKRG